MSNFCSLFSLKILCQPFSEKVVLLESRYSRICSRYLSSRIFLLRALFSIIIIPQDLFLWVTVENFPFFLLVAVWLEAIKILCLDVKLCIWLTTFWIVYIRRRSSKGMILTIICLPFQETFFFTFNRLILYCSFPCQVWFPIFFVFLSLEIAFCFCLLWHSYVVLVGHFYHCH